jgi:hypothetical protein
VGGFVQGDGQQHRQGVQADRLNQVTNVHEMKWFVGLQTQQRQ